jgi:hypothetical protein
MFFLTRCTFWLGVVAWQLPWPGLAPGVQQPAIVLVRSLDAKAVLADIGALCSASPRVCAEAAKTAGAAAVVAPALRAGLSVKPQSAPAPIAAPLRLRTSPDSRAKSKTLARSETTPRRPEPPG